MTSLHTEKLRKCQLFRTPLVNLLRQTVPNPVPNNDMVLG